MGHIPSKSACDFTADPALLSVVWTGLTSFGPVVSGVILGGVSTAAGVVAAVTAKLRH